MAQMDALWQDPSFLAGIRKQQPNGAAQNGAVQNGAVSPALSAGGPAATASPKAVPDRVHTESGTAQESSEAVDLQAQIKNRLEALAGPYKEAVAANGEDAQELREQFGIVKTSLAKRDFDQADQSLGALEKLVDQRGNPPAPGIPGMDRGQVQAIGLSDLKDIPIVGPLVKGIEGEVLGSTKVKITITNKSDKTLQ